jgi:hypothetical protein
MRAVALLALIAIAHIAFVFGAYGTGLFGLRHAISYAAFLFIWLVCSSGLAGWGYFKVSTKLLGSSSARLLLSILVGAGSLYAGVFFAFNTFGT